MDLIRPALVVGLGGTGSKAVAQLKQRLITEQRWRALSGDTDPAGDLPVLLRAVDLDRQNAPQELSTNVEQIFLNAPIGPLIDKIRDQPAAAAEAYPAIMSWFTTTDARNVKPDEVKEFMSTGAGQVRAFGRLAFFTDLANDRVVPNRFRAAFDDLTRHHAGTELPLYIVSSVAGGTGAGLLIDMLAWLQKERGRGGVAFRTTVFLVLSAAFNRTLHGRLLKAGEANGYAVMRELDRLLECRDPVAFEWGVQERHELKTPPTQHLYLIDGQRGDGAQVHLNRHDAGLVCPPAVADAIYAHLMPSASSELTSYLANVQEHEVGRRDLYSTFGVYTVELIWDQLIRGFTARACGEIVGRLLRPAAPQLVLAERNRFFAGAAVAAGVELPQPPLFKDLAAKTAGLRPRRDWLCPAVEPLRIPTEPALAAAFPELKAIRTPYDSRDLVRRVEERMVAYWGDVNGEWSRAAEKQFHPVANQNRNLLDRGWSWTLRMKVADLMSDSGGGPAAGLAFAEQVHGELTQYRLRLEAVNPPAVEAARQRLADARDKAITAKLRKPAAQREYLEQAQRLLAMEATAEFLRRARQIIERFIEIVEDVLRETRAWQSTVEHAGQELAARLAQVIEERKDAERVPLRRAVPRLSESALEQDLYLTYAGTAQPGALPKHLAEVADRVRWGVAADATGWSRLIRTGPAKAEQVSASLVDDLAARVVPVFAPLRTRSIFDVLARSGQDPIELSRELVDGGAWLARYDKSEHDRFVATKKADSQLQEQRYAYAQWPAASALGGGLAGSARQYLVQQGVKIHDIVDSARPTSDKIVYFAARHRLLLGGFTGFLNLRESYTARRAAPLSPHVLREEKGAARLEALAEQLVDVGLRRVPLEQLTGRALLYCADLELLCAAGIALANETLRIKMGERDKLEGWWVVTDECTDEIDSGRSRLGDLVRRLAAGRSALDRRHRSLVLAAADEARRYPDYAERAQRWFVGEPAPYVEAELWEVLSVATHFETDPYPR